MLDSQTKPLLSEEEPVSLFSCEDVVLYFFLFLYNFRPPKSRPSAHLGQYGYDFKFLDFFFLKFHKNRCVWEGDSTFLRNRSLKSIEYLTFFILLTIFLIFGFAIILISLIQFNSIYVYSSKSHQK